MPKISLLEKGVFVLSFAALAFLYGFAACAWGLFPKRFLLTAWNQAEQTAVVSYAKAQVLGPSPENFLAPNVYDRGGMRLERPEKAQPGLTLLASWWKDSKGWYPAFRLVSHKGRVLHEWRIDGSISSRGFARRHNLREIHGSYLFANGDVIFNWAYRGAVRIDACGDVRWRLKEGNHHSVARAEDGTFWVPGESREPRSESKGHPDGFPGLDGPVWMDQILQVGEDGTLHQRLNVLDLLYANDLERYIAKKYPAEGPYTKDITHLNDVEPLPSAMAGEYPLFDAGDLLVSLRNLDLVFVVDPDTKAVKWHVSKPFVNQHDPDFMGEGWIGVFDNRRDFTERGRMLGGSRIVGVQPHTDSTNVLFPTSESDPFYTDVQGKWQRLDNGNMLLTEAQAGRVVEVDPEGRTVWEWIHEPVHEPYETPQVPEVTEGTRYDLTRGDLASWSCSSVDSVRTSTSLTPAQNQQTAR